MVTTTSPGRRRDRQVYLRSHPILFALLWMARRAPVRRLAGTVLVNDPDAYIQALTQIPLDRSAGGTVGGSARRLDAGGILFDQDGAAHRDARRSVLDGLGSAGVARLRPQWLALLRLRLAPLATGGTVDLVEIVTEMAGVTAATILGISVDPGLLAAVARETAAAVARTELPGWPRPGRDRAARAALDRLVSLVRDAPAGADLAGMIAVAAVNTSVAALPRAVAWCADDRLWPHAADADRRSDLAAELLRVTAASPLLPRVAGAPGTVGGHPISSGDRLILVARHAAGAHRGRPDPVAPAPPRISQLVFGAGQHACPGARLARTQLTDLLAMLAPHRPVVVDARADRRSALPGWASLRVRAVAG
jgi:cytochrome P450